MTHLLYTYTWYAHGHREYSTRKRRQEGPTGQAGDERGDGDEEGEYRSDVTKPPWGAYKLVINAVSQWPLRDKCSSWEK